MEEISPNRRRSHSRNIALDDEQAQMAELAKMDLIMKLGKKGFRWEILEHNEFFYTYAVAPSPVEVGQDDDQDQVEDRGSQTQRRHGRCPA